MIAPVRAVLQDEVEKADCRRRRVGAALIKDGKLVGRGHNALQIGSCLGGDCPRGLMTYEQQPRDVDYVTTGCTSIHAEHAAILEAGEEAAGSVCYVTEYPCPICYQRLVDAKVSGIQIVTRSEGDSN